MAFDFKKLNFFSKLDARARVFVLFGGVIGVIVLIYLLTIWISGGSSATGPSRVAAAPQGLQSVPGGQLTPAYYQALMQANKQAAQQAQMSGGTAVPTLINTASQMSGNASCILCLDQSANIKPLMDDWVRQGKLSPDTESQLQALADRNVLVGEFGATLDVLIKGGKIAPDQARQLTDVYRKQYANARLADSAKFMDNLIKAGSLPVDVATLLLDAQRNMVTTAQYSSLLQKFVRDGRLTADIAQQLLTQYSQMRAKEIVAQSLVVLHQMMLNGEITPDIEKGVADLEKQLVSLDSFTATMKNYVSQNKITPAVSDKIIDEYKMQKTEIGSNDALDKIPQAAIAAAKQELSDLLKTNAITPDVAQQLSDMIDNNVSFSDFQNAVNGLVQQKKLTPDIAKLKIADYLRIIQARALVDRLLTLQRNNASPAEYEGALKEGVAQGVITPDQAAQLMRDYQAMTARTPAQPAAGTTAAYARLQERVQQTAPSTQVATPEQFNVPPVQQQPQVSQPSPDRQAEIAAMRTAMSNQAQQLVVAWQPPAMLHKDGVPPEKPTSTTTGTGATGSGTGTNGSNTTSATTPAGPVIIKAGTILFAVLDTTANSDYPDAPVLATIVDGPYKGAKLLGKLQTSKNVAGQLDRIILTFTMMNTPDWPSTKSITAYGVDPDTAKTALATDVNNHYLQRYGALLGASFVQGYATAITTSGSSQVNGSLGTTTTTHPTLGSSDKIWVGVGQAGQTFGSFLQNWVNIPPTVKVDAGVGLGILFMADVS